MNETSKPKGSIMDTMNPSTRTTSGPAPSSGHKVPNTVIPPNFEEPKPVKNGG